MLAAYPRINRCNTYPHYDHIPDPARCCTVMHVYRSIMPLGLASYELPGMEYGSSSEPR